MDYVTLVLLVCVLGLLLLVLLRRPGRADTSQLQTQLQQLQQQLGDEFERNRRENQHVQKDMRAEMQESLQNMHETLHGMTKSNYTHLQQLTETITRNLESIRNNNLEQNERQSRTVSESIARMQESNEKRLEEMRLTVDEKLQSTLSQRLDSSFKTVSDQLENVYKSLGEMKNLSEGVTTNVTTLNRVLTNVKARGTWAEVQLDGILQQTIPGMYEQNFAPVDGSAERVEFAIKIPAGDGNKQLTYLPIDSKFPMEDYVRLCDAADRANAEDVLRARKDLERRVLDEAKMIAKKYVNVPRTTPFAILYLATEGLYAEIASSRSGLPERIQHEHNVMIAGPTTITALLNSLSMGFRVTALNEKANEIRLLLGAAKKQYDKFGDALAKARRKIDEAGDSLSDAQNRNRLIQKQLRNVEALDMPAAQQVLGLPEDDV